MPTRQQLKDALIKAHNAGDFEAAQLFADRIRSGGFGGQTTALGRAGEFAKGVPRGFLSSFATGAEGLASLADVATDFVGLENLVDSGDQNELIRLARAGQEKVDEKLGADPAYRDLWTTKFGDALGSLGSFLVPGGAVKLLSAAGKGTKAGVIATTPLAVGMGAGEQSQRIQMAREQGLDVPEGAEDLSILGGALVGLTELAPVGQILRGMKRSDLFDADGKLKPLAQTWLPRLKNALKSGSAEGVQEVSAGLMQDAIEKGLYNPELPVGESAWEEFTLGGAAGATADLLMNAMVGRRRSALTEQERAREMQARAREQELLQREVERNQAESGQPLYTPQGRFQPGRPARQRAPLKAPQPTLPLPPMGLDPNIPDPTAQVVDLASRYDTALGSAFPLTRFTSMVNDTPSTRVVDPQGNQYGPTFERAGRPVRWRHERARVRAFSRAAGRSGYRSDLRGLRAGRPGLFEATGAPAVPSGPQCRICAADELCGRHHGRERLRPRKHDSG